MPTSDAGVLERLYESAHGAAWNSKARWLSAGGVCSWHGIECQAGEVTSVDLGGNGVRGVLPESLAALTSLKVLNIDDSQLSGTLPALGSLTALETILLASNPELSGTLPDLRQLRQLKELDVSRTRLSGSLGASLGSLSRLQRLQLDHTSLHGVLPPQIGVLTRVTSLFVHNAPHLSGTLPTEIGGCTALAHGSSIARTRISGTIPPALGRLTRLRQLWLDHTRLSGTLPTAIGRLRSLDQLELHACRLSGSLPSELSALPSLRACCLTAAQGPHQPRHGLRPLDDGAERDTNRFSCPWALPVACVPHLNCTEHRARAVARDDGELLGPAGLSRGRRGRKHRGGRRRLH